MKMATTAKLYALVMLVMSYTFVWNAKRMIGRMNIN
jgi:hypothetical protein